MAEQERCNGPGRKIIFETKRAAQDALRRKVAGRRARVGNGMVQACTWALGQHWHITSHKKPYSGGRR